VVFARRWQSRIDGTAADWLLLKTEKVVYPCHYREQDVARFKALVGDVVEVRLRDWYS